ncbi:hypothetical protein ACRALDRAFT_1074608 [Sodiomyces alcalophilus JCM 7366]|uniref:uncharacterized protein n=1 Tax=Sodiomyces alcalophilus JCM 7366 TaxID=591952 RepID=UPI0039B512CC
MMAHEKVDFEALRQNGLAEEEERVVAIFESAFASLSEATADDAAKSTALELQKLVSPELPEDQFEVIWQAFISIARHLHYQHESQDFLIKVLRILVATEAWKDLPCLARIMRDHWIDPTFETVEGEEETYSLSEWLSLNSFHARLLGSGIVSWDNFALWQLKHGLEQEMSASEPTDCRVAVASEWLVHASPLLLRRCLEEMGELNDLQKRSYSPGDLFPGYAGLNAERWGFWKRRLAEVRPLVGDDTAARVDLAIRRMTEAATAIAQM